MLDLRGDPIALTAALVDIPSESRNEARLADEVEAALRAQTSGFEIIRNGDAVLARTAHGRPSRVLLAGHLDTVPVAGNLPSRRQDGAGSGERRDSGRERGRKCANLLPVIAQADLDAGELLDVATDGAGAERCNILLRQEAYASAVDARGAQLAYNSLEFNFALQRANDFSQLAL